MVLDGYVGPTDQDSAYERYSGAAGEGLGVAVPFIGASSKYAQTAQQLPKVGQYAQNTGLGTRVLDTMTKPFVTPSPGTAVTAEAGLSAISSVGIQAEEDLFGTQTGLGGLLPFARGTCYLLWREIRCYNSC